ncbi:unnamed protein product [Paramecium primaurelia]|uniref:Triosephosphate isomerase n=1 Tax=Paramecium primaurelia TaxID=5886 RepID=A0A8S1MHF5_PARPR|nr:unnamed protein product [Paramecium primaurelia]
MQAQRKRFIGGNWKSNNTLAKSLELVDSVVNKLEFDNLDVVVSPVSLHIVPVQQAIKNNVQVALQNIGHKGFGAFTGELSFEHVKDLKINWVILGHSERRRTPEIQESEEFIATKAALAINNGLSVIFCIGETIQEMEAKETQTVLEKQLNPLIAQVKDWSKVVVAYEPVWAIGTGKTATPEYAEEIHANIRKLLPDQSIRILYGGSVTKDNAAVLIGQPNIDGFLVGGASLKEDFIHIVNACK